MWTFRDRESVKDKGVKVLALSADNPSYISNTIYIYI